MSDNTNDQWQDTSQLADVAKRSEAGGELQSYPVVTNKAGRSYVVDGIEARQLANGAILAVDTGRIVANPQAGLTNGITTQNNTDIRSKMFERRLQAQLAAGRGLASGTGSAEELQAIERMTAKMAELVMNRDDRVAVEAYRAGLSAAGFAAQPTQRDTDGNQPAIRLELNQSAVAGLLALVEAWREGESNE